MAPTELLRAQARRSYELGRLRAAARLAPIIVAVAIAAMACGRPAGLSSCLALLALPLAVGLGWRGGAEGRAVLPGLVAGTVALSLPLAVQTLGHFCLGPACMTLCQPACVLGGAIAGAFIAVRGGREEEGQLRFVAAAVVLAGLLGALGCTLTGVAGVTGMIAGAIATGAPVLLRAHARR